MRSGGGSITFGDAGVKPTQQTHSIRPESDILDTVFVIAGLGLLIGGGEALVRGAVGLALRLGMSAMVIGLTVVGFGTSMHEMVTSVTAARKGQADVALGNIIGSNIFNLIGILGVTAVIAPVPVTAEIAALDIWVMLAATVAVMVMARTGWRLSRAEAGVLLAGYVTYLGVLLVRVL